MRSALALFLALLVAGCARAPEPIHDEEPSPTTFPLPFEPKCARASLAVQEPIRWPEVTLVALVTNCGARTIEVRGDGCHSPTFSVFARRGVNEFLIPANGSAARLMPSDDPCEALLVAHLLPPDEPYVEEFRWNGTFASDPCVQGSCPRVAPVGPEQNVTFHLVVIAGDERLEATANAMSPPWPDRPLRGACVPLTIAAVPAELRRGEETNVTLRLSNCGEGDITFGDSMRCDLAYGLKPLLRNGTYTWDLDAPGAALDPGSRGCLSMDPPDRVLFPGESVEYRTRWNGTMTTCQKESWMGCAPREHWAEPGAYTVEAIVVSREGDAWSASAPLTVL